MSLLRIRPVRTALRYLLVVLGLALLGVTVNWALGSFERPDPGCDDRDAIGHQGRCD